MNARMETARLWWLSRSGREQVLLAVMAVAVLGVVGWYGVIAPLHDLATSGRERVETASTQLARLKVVARAQALSGRPGGASPQALVEASAAKAGVPISRRRQEASGQFTIWITAIDARVVLPWTASLEREGAVRVANFTASRLDGGLVEVEVTFAKFGS